MENTIKYAKNKGYCYDNRHLFSELRKLLLKEENPVITKDITTIKLHKLVESMNQVMAKYFIENQELQIPYLGTLIAFERDRYYNYSTNRTNLPINWGITRQMKRDGELGNKRVILNTDPLKLVKIRFINRNGKTSLFQFRVCQDVATKLIHYIIDNNISLLKDFKYDKRD